ncbi:MAG: EAL domain-containing protein [Halanaerobiales bacterium]|nr:EAL domain-containing protein [Halanaerobiales bacterium]
MHYLLKNYTKIKKYKYKPITIIIIAFMLWLSGIIVYYTGGTQQSYLHLVYIPILISAYFYKRWGGLIAGVIAGLLLGPYMPIDTNEMLMQAHVNWSFRMFFFVLIGLFAGSLFRLLELQLNKINKIAYYNESIELPNKTKLKNILSEKIENGEEFQLIIFSIKNYSDIYKLVGSKYFSSFIKELIKHISEYNKINNPLFYINDSKYAMYIEKHSKVELINKLRKFTKYLNKPVKFKEVSIYTDIIMGISTYPKDGKDCDEIIEKAFLAIDKVKNEKLNFWIYEREAVDVNYNNIELLGDIDNSIKNNNFLLYYQPKINLKTDLVDAYEALIRWNHPKEGFIPPAEFIPKVERSSLIEPLTDWVIEQSLKDIIEYEEIAESKELHVAINISARNFQEPSFIDRLFDYLDKSNLAPEKFAIEITETDLMIEMDKNIRKLSQLREKGVKVYLDDFGKGYSSLRYLKELPIDYIKIDQFFINNIDKNSTNRDIVLSIIKLSHALDIKVVAEGVETKEQLDFLKENNCDFAQGYYFTRPDKKEEIFKWTAKHDEKHRRG